MPYLNLQSELFALHIHENEHQVIKESQNIILAFHSLYWHTTGISNQAYNVITVLTKSWEGLRAEALPTYFSANLHGCSTLTDLYLNFNLQMGS